MTVFMLSVTISSGTPPNEANASSRKEESTSCDFVRDTLYILNLEYESSKQIYLFPVSPDESINGIDSFQSNCACFPISVSYLTITLLTFDGCFFSEIIVEFRYFLICYDLSFKYHYELHLLAHIS